MKRPSAPKGFAFSSRPRLTISSTSLELIRPASCWKPRCSSAWPSSFGTPSRPRKMKVSPMSARVNTSAALRSRSDSASCSCSCRFCSCRSWICLKESSQLLMISSPPVVPYGGSGPWSGCWPQSAGAQQRRQPLWVAWLHRQRVGLGCPAPSPSAVLHHHRLPA